jgi:hypothetical protein
VASQCLIYEGKQFEDQLLLSNYNSFKDYTLFLVIILCGGFVGKGVASSSKPLFKDVVTNKSTTSSYLNPSFLSTYIVDKLEKVLLLEVSVDIMVFAGGINLHV